MSKEKLVKVSTYARRENVSVQTVYKWIAAKRIESVIIDKVVFVKSK